MSKITVIGAGLSGLYAACYLAKKGFEVEVYEKNESAGGRSRVFESDGFMFDMGPSWYWMPELIDSLFEDLGEDRKDYFSLKRLDPSYRVFWKDDEPTDVPASLEELRKSSNPNWDGPYLPKAIPMDPWGKAYIYTVPGEDGDPYGMMSYGLDGEPGGEGENEDVIDR